MSIIGDFTCLEWKRLVSEVSAQPRYPLIEIMHVGSFEALEQRVNRSIVGPWNLQGCILDTVKKPMNWNVGDRTQLFLRHSLSPLGPLLTCYWMTGRTQYLDISMMQTKSWISWEIENRATVSKAKSENFGWYDMAVGQRIYRLAYLLLAAAYEGASYEEIAPLIPTLEAHFTYLLDADNFAGHSNHGIFQLLGLLAASKLLERHFQTPAIGPLEVRLADIFNAHFAADGGHLEHSPGYHFYMTQSLRLALNEGLFQSERPRMERLADKSERILAFMTTPDGFLVPFGDTDYQRVHKKLANITWNDSYLREILELGAQSPRSNDQMLFLPDSGYAFVRSPNSADPKADSYFAHVASFHSRVHKQADHMTVFWQEASERILDDPGRFGYRGRTDTDSDAFRHGFWYSDPGRMFVESTRGHNCVVIDGQSYRRGSTDIFGSATKKLEKTEFGYRTVSSCCHENNIIHERVVNFVPGKLVVVCDRLESSDGQSHSYSQNFQLAAGWKEEHFGKFRSSENSHLHIDCLPSSAIYEESVSGQTEPNYRGWVSRKPYQLEAAPSFGFAQESEKSVEFVTVLRYSTDSEEMGLKDVSINEREIFFFLENTGYRFGI